MIEGTKNFHTTFKKVLLEASQNKKKFSDAIKEWTFYGETFKEKSNCICGHPIIKNCLIHNTLNKATLITGNCCINKLGVEKRSAKISIKNYLELCFQNAKSDCEKRIVKSIIKYSKEYGPLKLTPIQLIILENLAEMKYRWKWYETKYDLLHYQNLKQKQYLNFDFFGEPVEIKIRNCPGI